MKRLRENPIEDINKHICELNEQCLRIPRIGNKFGNYLINSKGKIVCECKMINENYIIIKGVVYEIDTTFINFIKTLQASSYYKTSELVPIFINKAICKLYGDKDADQLIIDTLNLL